MRVKLSHTLLFAVLFAFGTLPACAFTVNLRDMGIRQYNARQYSQAVVTLTRAAQMYKGDGLAQYYLANSLLKMGQTNKAIVAYKRAYYLSNSEQMAKECARALETFNVRVPLLPPDQWKVRTARANLTPVTSAPVNQLSSLAEHKFGDENLESHPGGLEKFSTAPEGGALAGKWDQWIENFRIAFNTVLFQRMGKKSSALWGNTRMVFSIDSSRQLRGKILESDSPYFFRYYLLETTRVMDRTQGLQFPAGSTIPGYNFTMGWSQGRPKSVDKQTLAELRQLAYQLRRDPITGQRAAAGRLDMRQVAGTASSKDVSASLRTTGVNGALASQNGLKTSAKMGALPLPSFSTSVSGLVMPGKKEKNSAADSGQASASVHGELAPDGTVPPEATTSGKENTGVGSPESTKETVGKPVNESAGKNGGTDTDGQSTDLNQSQNSGGEEHTSSRALPKEQEIRNKPPEGAPR